MNFLPTTPEEIKKLGWPQADIILVSGDTYIDSPFIGVAVIGRVLSQAGFKVGIIAQPDIDSDHDISRLGEPRLFWGVTGGSVDSMVANYTASDKRRKSDDFTPGGQNNRRPDRAVIAYTNLIRRSFKNTCPIVLGGIEASLRRLAHYDYWSNRVRKSVLFDAKADILVYGMAEKTILVLAEHLQQGLDFRKIPGLCYPSSSRPEDFLELPDFSEVAADQDALIRMFHTFYQNNDPLTAHGLAQRQDANRYLVQNPPAALPSTGELDQIHELPFSRSVHPYYLAQGKVMAQATIQVLEARCLPARAARLGAWFTRRLARVPGVRAVRGRGLMIAAVLDGAALLTSIVCEGVASPAVGARVTPLSSRIKKTTGSP